MLLVAVALLAAWLGSAVITSAVVAPAAFAVLPSRTLAGALVGRVLPVLFWSGMILGAVVLVSSRRVAAGVPLNVSALAFALACGAAQFVISPRIEAIRVAIGGPVEALDAADPRRQLFGKLHGLSVLCLGAAGIAALIALVLIARRLKPESL